MQKIRENQRVDGMACDVITSLNMIYQNKTHNYYFFGYNGAFGVSASFQFQTAFSVNSDASVRAVLRRAVRVSVFFFFFFFSLPTGLGFAGQ